MKYWEKFFSLFGELERPVKWSVIFHVVIIILVTVGVPHCIDRRDMLPQPIVVDLVPPSDVTAAPNKNIPKPQPKAEEKKPDKPKPAPKSEPEKQADKPKPKKPEPKKPEPKKPEPKKPEPKPEPKLEKKPPKKPASLDDMIEKLAKEEPKPEQKEEPKKDFSSVLKNLAESDSTPQEQTPDSRMTIDTDKNAAKGWAPTVSDTLSLSQLDVLQNQLAGCWLISPGARDAENLIIDLYVEVNSDRTVRTVEIVDKARYNRDTFFRAAADSAIRAVRSPNCSPLALPPDKYDLWKTMTIRFNPKEMFGG